jgi:hypothetical protein
VLQLSSLKCFYYKVLKSPQPGLVITLQNQLESVSNESNGGIWSDWKHVQECMAAGALSLKIDTVMEWVLNPMGGRALDPVQNCRKS